MTKTRSDIHSKSAPKSGTENLPPDDGLTQSERFIKAAQELGTDDDPERFAERVRKLAKGSSGSGSKPVTPPKDS
jgi:hypothetical protein